MSDLRALLGEAALRLSMAGIDSPRLDARLLLAHAMTMRPDELVGSIDVPSAALGDFEAMLARRILREPLAYITGHKEFWSLDFEVGPGVLVPRPETETLIEAVLKYFPDRSAPLRFIDLGTGSGCLPIAALSEYPNARGAGVDASEDALRWARHNIEKHALGDRCRFERGNWNAIPHQSSDVILSNPPYIKSADIPTLSPEVRKFEPVLALDGGPDGLDAYRSLAALVGPILRPNGRAFLEIGQGQAEAVSALMGAQGLKTTEILADLAGIPRCVVLKR
ncbi:MAG TPA: peptide chain release factor N(5)-glutamine methyltransferase [Rhizomicrobium sp.]|nr:peptide chain release factor N(5)-glutamine methyltransferase [Rhizomicrobium sp.]